MLMVQCSSHHIALVLLSLGFAALGTTLKVLEPLSQTHPESQGHHQSSLAIGSPSSPRLSPLLPPSTPTWHPTLFERLKFAPQPLSSRPTVSAPLLGFCHPLDGQGQLSQGIRGLTHKGRSEYAYDIAIGLGTPVFAMRAGEVIGAEDKYPDIGGGSSQAERFNYVLIEHPRGYRSAYAHLQQGFQSRTWLTLGAKVQAGQLIGFSGNSGWSTGPHLHVEVQQPSSGSNFTQTVPFQIAGHCQSYST